MFPQLVGPPKKRRDKKTMEALRAFGGFRGFGFRGLGLRVSVGVQCEEGLGSRALQGPVEGSRTRELPGSKGARN